MSFVTAACIAQLGGAAWLVINPLKAWRDSDADSKRLPSADY
jgi:hypothetical protein